MHRPSPFPCIFPLLSRRLLPSRPVPSHPHLLPPLPSPQGVVSPTGTTPNNAQVTLPKDVKSWQIELVKDQFPDAKVLVA